MLREKQQQAYVALRQGFAAGHLHQILTYPTGGGKTHVAGRICMGARDRGVKVAFIVDRLVLVDQALERFEGFGLRVGVIQGQHPQWDPGADVQVCTVQTLARRKFPEVGLIIIDEVHVLHKAHMAMMAAYDAVPVIGLTATPFTKGLGKHFTNVVIGATPGELMDDGLLVRPWGYGPSTPELKGVKTVAGDWAEDALAEVMNKPKLVGDIISTWLQKGENRQTLCYATNIAHSKAIVSEFCDAGVPALHIDAYSLDADTREAIRSFKMGDTRILSSVTKLAVGFDAPHASCLIFARPTKSLTLHLQTFGRGLRIYEGKSDCLILDHAGNCARLGFPDDEVSYELDMGEKGKQKERKKREGLPKPCPACTALIPAGKFICPSCGFKPERQNHIESEAGELKALRKTNREATVEQKREFYAGLLYHAERKGYRIGWVGRKYREKFGVWPRGPVRETQAKPPSEEVRNYITYAAIKYAKAKQAEKRV